VGRSAEQGQAAGSTEEGWMRKVYQAGIQADEGASGDVPRRAFPVLYSPLYTTIVTRSHSSIAFSQLEPINTNLRTHDFYIYYTKHHQ
jgi:hypothetical protein